MNDRLCILVCRNFLPEVSGAIEAEGWEDVTAAAFPARCGRPPVTAEELAPLVPAGCSRMLLIGRACLSGMPDTPPGLPPGRVEHLGQCFYHVAGAHLVDALISGGAYLLTPAWLADWRGRLAEMGFAQDQAGALFQEFAKELVLLDSGIDPHATERLAEFGAVAGLPVRHIPVGLDHTRERLARRVLEWRLEQAAAKTRRQARQHARELADHVSAMDMLTRLARTQREEEAIAAIVELFQMLFAPEAVYYLRVENEVAIPVGEIPAETAAALTGLQGDYAWSADGRGFLLRISQGGTVLGRVAVERLTFPQYRERYLNLALAVTGVCGLAIENARNRRRLVEAEKMASLGILVAGVAHEINTPLGIGLTAASTLRNHSRNLTRSFGERSMTQSDLNHYLETAAASTDLLCANLERIGQLIDAFRQVAVEGKPLERRPVRIRECIDEVLRGLGDRLPADRVQVEVHCDPQLVIQSSAGDWSSIFVNLISNSLKHGFKGRERGRIALQVGEEASQLRIDYRDDGVGLDPEGLARVFDPFYTTDLQHGMGLGMHLVYNLITHRMGGRIRCESRIGEGMHCRIEIPLETPT